MGLYAISDLHLALGGDKPMHVFGENWLNHHEKIKENWINKINENDTVLIGGDISWSMRMAEGQKELEWIHNLPGNKILIKGNHDYWWTSITKLNSMFSDMQFIQNNFFTYEDYAICGTRGWTCPGGENYTSKDEKIYNREIIRLKLSLDGAVKAGYKNIIGMIHYPPTTEKFAESEITKIFSQYAVEKVIYGHLHGPALYRVFEGSFDGVEYILTSADYIDFNPIKIFD
jgi:predicted phosphohydrolase